MNTEISNEINAEAMTNNETINNSESRELVLQAAGNAITVANEAFEEIDLSEFGEVCDSETLVNVSNAFSNGALKPKDLMPIMINPDGISGVYAKRVIKFDDTSHSALVFCRIDGSCTEDIPIDNKDLYDVCFGACATATEKMKNDGEKALKRIRNKMLEYWDGRIMFDAQCVAERVATYQSRLPVDNQIPDIKKVYAKIVGKAEEQINHPYYCNIFRKGFYAFPPELFAEIAKELQMTSTKLAQLLKRNGLLHLQDSSIGYQCYVNYFKDNCYCVLTIKQYQHEVAPLESPEELYKKL